MKFGNLISIALAYMILGVSCTPQPQKQNSPKNVIIFIGDGMGFNHVDATSIFMHGESGKLVFEGPEWLKLAQATYPAVMKFDPDTVFSTGYNPRLAWSDTAYLKTDFTDSGAAGTALSTGFKTYKSAIGIGIYGDTLQHMSQLAKDLGKSAGVITSVQLSHATPAAFTAHSENRRNYEQIGKQMILKSKLDVLMGCGHPAYSNDGQPTDASYRYIGNEEIWKQLNEKQAVEKFEINGKTYLLTDTDGNGKPNPWTLITDSVEFAAIARGENLPKRLLGIPKVATTLQQSRIGSDTKLPWQQPRTPDIPSLEQMTMAAVNVLNQNPNGFFLMVEGGAIDWAAHDNHPGRLIEEMYDFERSIATVVEWVEKYSSWDETLVVVTSDHETGMLWGPVENGKVLTRVKSQGKGVLPAMEWYSDDHTNTLVPVYARGKGSEMYKLLADEFDPVKGPFIQNTDVAKAVFILWNLR